MTASSPSAANNLMQAGRRIIDPAVRHIRAIAFSGLTTDKLIQTLCVGVAVGTLPLLWGTSFLCITLASAFRLNHVVLQSINYLLWPVNLALIIPFVTLGSRLISRGPAVPAHLLSALLKNPGFSSINSIGWLSLKALAAWSITVLPVALITYMVTSFISQTRSRRHARVNR